jgi:hypothetical protein
VLASSSRERESSVPDKESEGDYMSRRRIAEIAPISATASSSAVDIGRTTSITSDPDGRWVAARQSAITVAMERRHVAAENDQVGEAPKRFSGESERIGRCFATKETPFGERFGYL